MVVWEGVAGELMTPWADGGISLSSNWELLWYGLVRPGVWSITP